jgi:hypothetical protein
VRPVRRRSEVAEVIALEISSTSTLEHRSEDAPTAAANYLESQSEGSRRVVLLRLRQVLAVVLERIPTAREALSHSHSSDSRLTTLR